MKEYSEKYKQQLEKEKRNKELFSALTIDTSVGDYYFNHSYKETMEKFNIPTHELLLKILKATNFDFEYKKKHSIMKGKKSTRTHASYIAGGKKSAETQINNWNNKTEDEKKDWSIKQSLAHLNSPTYKNIKCIQNREYRNSLTAEQRKKQDEMRREAMIEWWSNFTPEQKADIMNKKFENGAGYKIKDSKPNIIFKNILETNNIEFIQEYKLAGYSYDFKVGNTVIEINPTVFHNVTWSPFNNCIDKDYHYNKTSAAVNAGIKCIHIFDWDDKYKIVNLLSNREKVYARKCIVREISKQEAQDFINIYHTQCYARDYVRIGLFYNNDLVSVMTFGKPRYNKNYKWELVRFCSSKNIVGGCSKLFSFFINKYHPESIISYCDLSKFTGHTYTSLGFELIRKTKPTRHWYNMKTKQHITDNLLRQRGFDQLFGTSFGKGVSNEELMLSNGFVEIYDCGQATYIWTKPIDKEN